MPRTETTLKNLKNILPSVVKSLKDLHALQGDEIKATWPEIIGQKFSPMTEAVSFSDGALKVKVKNSTLHSLLVQHEKKRLLEELRRRFPGVTIKTIIFRIG